MIQWKQRLYAFLLRRVLGPFLDVSETKKLHDSIDFSLQEGKFVLKDICLNAEYLSERLAASGSAISIRKATVQRLEICFSLRENVAATATAAAAQEDAAVRQSSFAWRAMKLGGGTTAESSLPAVSLVADIHVQGVELELMPLDPSLRQRPPPPPPPPPTVDAEDEATNAKSMIGSYVDAALSSLLLTLKLSNIHCKLCHPQAEKKETWVSIRLSSMTYKDLDLQYQSNNGASSAYKAVLNKTLELSDITIHAGEVDGKDSRSTVVAMAQGSGRVFYRLMEYSTGPHIVPKQKKDKSRPRNLSQDIEVNLNHQLNFSLDQMTLGYLQTVADSLARSSAASHAEDDGANSSVGSASHYMMEAQNSASSLLKNPLWDNEEADHEDLKAITGIMKQYREAYHLAENNQLRGGILVPSHAYIDDLDALEEDDAMTFDVFFDANDQSFYNAASALKESVLMFDDANEDGDSIQTKLRMHILAGCIKVNFRDSSEQRQVGPQEYVLLTLGDLNIAMSSARRRSELSLSLAHFEIEDAQLDTQNARGGSPGTVDIGSLLGFVSVSPDVDDYDNEMMVSQAPCMTFHVQLSKEQKNKKVVDCNLTLQPIEIMMRQRSLSNLANLAAKVGGNRESSTPSSESDETTVETEVSFACNCPSLTISLPLRKRLSTAPLFNRCGETLANALVREAYLGVTIDTIDFQWNDGDPETTEKGLESSSKFSFLHMIIFACAPVGDKVSPGGRMQRTDLALLNGRTEVDPYIPISIEYMKKLTTSKDGSLGRENFPIVPTISSFKARQEDEDDELKIDRLLFSKLQDVDADSRKNLRGADPQIAMITDAEKCDVVVRLIIPEIVVDLTRSELATVVDMLNAAKPDASPAKAPTGVGIAANEKTRKLLYLGVAVNVDQISLSLKQDFRIEDLYGDKSKKDRFSCLFAINKLRTHVLLNGADLRHVRVLMHDFGLYSAMHPRIDAEVRRTERDVRERVTLMKKRIRVYKESSVSPILYRSQIFTPICQDAPSFQIDIRDTGSTAGFTQRQVHVTLYHLTFRYNVDSEWIEKLKGLLPPMGVATSGVSETHQPPPSMTRLFISVADCNLDFTSPQYFEMASRSILRLGDFRFSSNVMAPASRNQAYSVSLGDLSYHVSNQRMAYSEEDMKLCRAAIIMPTNYLRSGRGKKPSIHGTTAEALLREMGFVEVLGLDSMDAVIAVTNWDRPGRKRERASDPGMTTSLTFGLLSISACKDSFDCFATTVGELQAKLTALTNDDIARIRSEIDCSRNNAEQPPASLTTTSPRPQQATHKPAIGQQPVDFFLLDGYEWTEIDHDPLRELEIPDGAEQVAGWYGNSQKSPKMVGTATTQSQGFPGRIIHHHFPLHSVINPMGDGDMSASKYAGEGAVLTLKSRLLVHKLAVKLRFFDGYDWPDKVTDRQKKFLKKSGNFVIEPIPRSEVAKAKEELSKELTGKLEAEYGENADHIKRKVAIMADLLANDEKEEEKSPFEDTPLPEDRAKTIEQETETRRLTRKTKLYLQVSANGVTVRMDSFEASTTHRLASVLSLSVSDMFIAETASLSYPVKMLGEWVNESEHPRDTRFGTLMLKMVTWKPACPITSENEIESDDCEITMQLLPMRAIIDQRAIHFARSFFHKEELEEKKESWSSRLHLIPPPRFHAFRVKPWKLKVDYIPQKLDVSALREGSIVELINISPIDGMIITLSQVSVEGVVGFGDVMGGLTSNWLQEIVSTQLHKFLANARPFEPITDVGQGVSDLVVLPYEAFKNGDDIRRAMSAGIKSLAETVTFQALTTTSRLTEYAATKMATIVGGRYHNSAANPLPARPTAAPKGVRDVTGHAMESLARGFQAANYKIVIVPYREYTRHGAAGAASSVLRGIPVMLVAPMTGATEALSYTLLGARNALRPDIRREEEASRTGFTSYDI